MKRIVFIIIISILPLILFSQDYSVASEYVFNNRNEENIKLLKHTFYNPEHKKLLTEFIEYKKR